MIWDDRLNFNKLRFCSRFSVGRWNNACRLTAFANRDRTTRHKFTDFTLMAGVGGGSGRGIRVHKVVLACQGLKIRQLLESTDSECLVFADLDQDSLEMLVDAMYTGERT